MNYYIAYPCGLVIPAFVEGIGNMPICPNHGCTYSWATPESMISDNGPVLHDPNSVVPTSAQN